MPIVSKEVKKKLFGLMLKIRKAEEKIVEVYAKEQQIRTPTHLSIGQEAVSAGLSAALGADDQVFAGHRCHAAYLAKGGDLYEFFAELCGRASGVSGGRAGSAHLTDPSKGIFSSPILGGTIPVAVGAALSFQMDRSHRVAVAVFGDAAVEEGVFAESLNFAITKKLSVLFLCENNLYSTHSPMTVRQPPSPIFERVRMRELKTQSIDGNDAILVYQTLLNAIEQIRGGEGPCFVECRTYRTREHVGPLFDYDRGYRTKNEVDEWTKRCPVRLFKERLIAEGLMTESEILQAEKHWADESDAAYAAALKSPWPEVATLLENVY